MEKQKLIYVESKAQFSPSSVSNKAIVFIKDTKEIWTHGTYFICSNVWATPITLTLSGDSTGSVSIDGSGNVTLQVKNKYLDGTDGITDANNAVQATSHKVSYYPRIGRTSDNLFPRSNNANAILTLNTHDYIYNHQLGFSSNKGIYHRTRNGGVWDSSWEKLLTSTNYTNYPHTFASLTNKPTTISGYGITDSIPIIKGGTVNTDTDLSTLGMTTSGVKFSISCTTTAYPFGLHAYSNFLMFRAASDTYSGVATDAFNGYATFIGGRNLETTANNIPNWWFKIKGNSGTTYDLNSIQNKINNLDSNYLRKSGGTMTGTLTLTTGSAYINDTASGYSIYGSMEASNTSIGTSGLATIFSGAPTLNMVLRTSGDNLYHYNHSKSARYLILDTNNYSSHALPLSGGTMTGALNFANNTWNLVGDDVYIGDCNVGGMLGIKSANRDTPGFAMYNSGGTLLGKLYASGTNLYWSDNLLVTASNVNSFLYEANLKWGGGNKRNSFGPLDAALIDVLGANRMAFANPRGIEILYSRDGGETWIDYEVSDSGKTGLFTTHTNLYLGKAGTAELNSSNNQLRVIITSNLVGLYTELKKFAIFIVDKQNQTTCTIEGLTKANVDSGSDTWTMLANSIGIGGNSGWSIVNCSCVFGSNFSNQYNKLRLTFKQTAYSGGGVSSTVIQKIYTYGGMGWSTPSTLANNGHLYSYNNSKEATFPAQVTATGFSGNLTGNVTGNLTGNADTASNISIVNPILAQPFEKNTIQIVSNPQGALAEQQGTEAAITHALRFNWYNTAYEIGNVRGGASNSLGFGVTYGNNNLCLLVKTNGTYSPYGFIGSLSGNASTASKWKDARTITLTGDVTGSVSLDGSSNVTLTTATAGTGTTSFLKCIDKRNSYPAQIVTSGGKIGAAFMSASKLGLSDGSYYDAVILRGYADSSGGQENALLFSKNTSSVYHSQYAFGSTTTWGTMYKFLDSGNYKNYVPSLSGEGATGTWGINISGTANKVANALTLQLNGGTTSGTNKFVYDGSAAYTVNITPEAIGASATSHTHSYLPLSGGTLGSTTAIETQLRLTSGTATLRLIAYSNTFNYIQSGTADFSGNAVLQITGYNGNVGSDLYLKFNNIYCRAGNYTNIDSGNYSSYALPLSGGTMTGALNTANIYPKAHAGFNIGSTSSYYNIMYAYYFKKYGSDDNYLLLGGGGHKAVSDFAPNNVATLSSSGMGNSDQWTLVFEKSYPANYWYAPTTMFYIRSGTAGCGILCFYNYWASGTQLNDYEREVWFFGAQKSETGITFGGANRDINDFFRIYIDKANFKYCIYYNRYNDQSLKIQELQFFTVSEPGEYLSTGSLRSSFFTNSTTVVDLPTESSTLVRVPIKTTYNHDRTIRTTKSVYASSFYENSDIRLKENIKRIDLSDLTKQVDLVQFNFKDDGTKKYGVIAQQLEQVGLQNLVYENNGNKAVDYISLLVLETQRLRNEIKELKEKLDKKELSS